MIPSLVLVRSGDKTQFRFTQKRNLNIGSDERADIIVNHDKLYVEVQVLGPGLNHGASNRKRKLLPHFFTSYSWHTDGINIRLVELKGFLAVVLLPCISLALIIFFSGGGFTSHDRQDWAAINLPARGIYGFCRQDRRHRDGVRLSFEARKAQPHRLFFIAGGKGDGTAIIFSINGVQVGDSVPLPAGWAEEASINIPENKVKSGINIVEVRPIGLQTERLSWGISEIRVTPLGTVDIFSPDTAINLPGSIPGALEKSNITGRELARYYKILKSWQPGAFPEISSHDKSSNLAMIEERMKDRLYQVAFEVRSQRIQGDDPAADQLLNDTKSWIPESWVEGWEIYNDLCR